MAYETRELSGSIFRNKKKNTDKHPDLTGEAKIDGKTYWVNGWKKTDKNGDTWVSLAFKEKDFSEAIPKEPQASVAEDMSDDPIPF